MAKNRKRDRWESSSDEEDSGDIQRNTLHHTTKTASALSYPKSFNNSSDPCGKESSVTNCMNAKDADNSNRTGHIAAVGNFSSKVTCANNTTQSEYEKAAKLDALPLHNPLVTGCRSVYDAYERLSRLDEGTYGIVWKARDLATDEIVALKQIKFDSDMLKEGFPVTAMREISVLLALSHECIVTVKETVVGKDFDKVFMVMEFMEMDLKEAMKRSEDSPFPQSELKKMLYQILSATNHVHEKWYLHRDLKTSNILVHKTGKIALCDFGLARKYQIPLRALTQTVITLWYRPPELLFGQTIYGPEVDMWSIGCIFGELICKDAILQGQGELDQIDKIFKLLGTPTEDTWPEFSSLPNSKTFRWKKEGSQLHKKFKVNSFSGCGKHAFLDGNGFDLLQRFMALDPKKRISAKDALNHAYFQEGVAMQTPRFTF